MVPRNAQLEDKLEEFTSYNHEYSQYKIDDMARSSGLHGSLVSEQNHSSSLCHLNDGQIPNNKYCEDPATFVKDIFGRQQKLNLKMNKILFDTNTVIIVEREHLKQEGDE